MSSGIYLYCIGWSQQLTDDGVSALDARPVDGSDVPLRVVRNDDLAALVSDTEVAQFDIERDQLMAHHHALEAAMTLGDILPVAFGTVAETEQDITGALLTETGDQLRANLKHVAGRVELALRVMWDEERLFQEIVEESAEIRRLRDAVQGVPEEQSFSERFQLGELTSEALEAKREYEQRQLLAVLEPLCVDLEVKPNRGEVMILNGSFLVDREREHEFDAAVQEVAAPREGRMMFRYLGPLPPATFVAVEIPGEE